MSAVERVPHQITSDYYHLHNFAKTCVKKRAGREIMKKISD